LFRPAQMDKANGYEFQKNVSLEMLLWCCDYDRKGIYSALFIFSSLLTRSACISSIDSLRPVFYVELWTHEIELKQQIWEHSPQYILFELLSLQQKLLCSQHNATKFLEHTELLE
jgi:hypothetical protein